jgi:hypothetical protein
MIDRTELNRETGSSGRMYVEENRYSDTWRSADKPTLAIDDDDPLQPGSSITVRNVHPSLVAEFSGRMQTRLRVRVVGADRQVDEGLPDVFGRYQLLHDGIRFIPRFPFERGVRFRVTFDALGRSQPGLSDDLTSLEFSLPLAGESEQTQVEHVFPSSQALPENLLRFYICFSNPMRRGEAAAHISLLGPDGRPAPDVLYRPPVELWDRSMRCLTVLLDPGRLKRGVGPNRELGPPLEVGERYTLVVDAGMIDQAGQSLRSGFIKPFCVTGPIREPVTVAQWNIGSAAVGSFEPLALNFPRSLDWALLRNSITIVTGSGHVVGGSSGIDQDETLWSFTPKLPWLAGSYEIRIDAGLEDVCGNSLLAPFDRLFRPASGLALKARVHSIPFCLAR